MLHFSQKNGEKKENVKSRKLIFHRFVCSFHVRVSPKRCLGKKSTREMKIRKQNKTKQKKTKKKKKQTGILTLFGNLVKR